MTTSPSLTPAITDVQAEIVENFAYLDDWKERYQYIIDLGRKLAPLPDEYRTEDNKVLGCQSQVWLHADQQDGRLYFLADSDGAISKGLISLLLRVFSGHTPTEVLNAPLDFINEIGLSENLSPSRANGLHSMVGRIRATAQQAAMETN